MTECISSLVEHIDIFALSTLEVESSPHSFTSSRDSYASCVSWGDAVPSEARNFGRLDACGHGCGCGCAAQGYSQRSSVRCERRHIQLRSTPINSCKTHAKWTIERGVVLGYGMPVAQNPAHSPPRPDGGEPPRRLVVGALARPVRASRARCDCRVRQTVY
jgi:hypothetical protein